MVYSELCHKIKQRMFWDKILFSPAPSSNIIREGYRINISLEKEEEIRMAKEILQKANVTVFEDKVATSFSDSVEPGDRTIRVTHQLSVINLRKMWAKEFEKSRQAQALRENAKNGRK